MQISYTAPLSRAIERMKAFLFRRPFEIETWFVVGFSAWLADIFTGGSSSAGSKWETGKHEMSDVADQLGTWLSHPGILLGLAFGLVVILVVVLGLSWISARAQFVFLDNVVHARPAVTAPWKRYARQGNSLFLWSAAFSFAWLVPLAAIAWPFAGSIASAVSGHGFATPDIPALIVGVSFALVCVIAIAVIATLMGEFVVPLMYRHDETALQAWGRFRPLLAANAGDFGAFVAFDWLVWLLAAIGLVVIGFMTCCIGLVLMAIPYVGAVVMLPVHVSLRAFGPEFLRQYGPEWDVFAGETGAVPNTAPAPASDAGWPPLN